MSAAVFFVLMLVDVSLFNLLTFTDSAVCCCTCCLGDMGACNTCEASSAREAAICANDIFRSDTLPVLIISDHDNGVKDEMKYNSEKSSSTGNSTTNNNSSLKTSLVEQGNSPMLDGMLPQQNTVKITY